MTILDKIVKDKIEEVQFSKQNKSIEELKEDIYFHKPIISVKKALEEISKPGIIAEHKRKSPSKGMINDKMEVGEIVGGYQKAGALAVSVLTDEKYFAGTTSDLLKAREILTIPVLRKEFMIDDYQVYEAKAMGADFILLIAACLSKTQSEQLAGVAKELGMDVLIEIHTEDELQLIPDNIDIVGVNNRNLKTFEVDINTSIKLADAIPQKFQKISESGISNIASIHELWKHGYKGFLIGENFMKTDNPGHSCIEFIDALYQKLN